MFTRVYLFLLILCATKVTSTSFFSAENLKNNLTIWIEELIITANAFLENNLILYIPSPNSILLYRKLSIHNAVTILTKSWKSDFNFTSLTIATQTYGTFIIVIQTLDDINDKIKIFDDSSSKATYLIFLYNFKNQAVLLNKLSQACLKYGIVKLIIAMCNKIKIDYYTIQSYQQGSRCGSGLVTNQFDIQNSIDIGKAKNLRNCTLKISWTEGNPFVNNPKHSTNPGLFIWTFNTIANLANISIEYQEDNEDYQNELYGNGSFWKQVTDIQNRKYDVALGRLYMNSSHYAPATFGPLFYCDRIVFMYPKEQPIMVYRHILTTFSLYLWISFLLVFSFVTFFFLLLTRFYQSDTHIQNAVSDIFIKMFGITLGSSVNIDSYLADSKLLLMCYILFSLILDAVYLGKLSATFTEPARSLVIDSDFKMMHVDNWEMISSWREEDLAHAHFFFGGNPGYLDAMKIYNVTELEILRRIAIRNHPDTSFSGSGFLSVVEANPYEESQIYLFVLLWGNHTLKTTFYMHQYNTINNILYYWSQELIEKGFLVKWWTEIKMINMKVGPKNSEHVVEAVVTKLSIKHYEEAFILLLSGYCLATITLVFEFIVHCAYVHVRRMIKYIFLPDLMLG